MKPIVALAVVLCAMCILAIIDPSRDRDDDHDA